MRLFLLFGLMLLGSCTNLVFRQNNMGVTYKKPLDSLVLVNAVVCDQLIDNLGRARDVNQELLRDSVVDLFTKSLSAVGVTTQGQDSLHRLDQPCFFEKFNIKYKHIDQEKVVSHAPDTIHPYLIPFIAVETRSWRNASSSLSGGFSGGGIYKAVVVRVMFVVVQNKAIRYFSVGYIEGRTFLVDELSDVQMHIDPSKMDELRTRFAEDYAKAVRKKKSK